MVQVDDQYWSRIGKAQQGFIARCSYEDNIKLIQYMDQVKIVPKYYTT